MIDHLTVKVQDAKKSKAFYAKALEPLGYEVLMEYGDFTGLGADKKPDLWIAPGKQEPLHLAFQAKDRKAVDAFYKAAIAAGATDNGKPGIRKDYHPNYYGAFVIDPNGHNLEAVCHKPQ
ncbi:MAG TPA: VOC family protein [Myxococcales bacterium]|nr:VOC family protein [Myxococcales bacterium]